MPPDQPSLTDLTRAMTQLTVLLMATIRLLRWLMVLQTLLMVLALLLAFFLAAEIRAHRLEQAELTRAMVTKLQALLEHLPPH